MTKKRSITQRLVRAGSPDLRLEIALDWAHKWRVEHHVTYDAFKRALEAGDVKEVETKLYHLGVLHGQKLEALDKVLEHLSGIVSSGDLDLDN